MSSDANASKQSSGESSNTPVVAKKMLTSTSSAETSDSNKTTTGHRPKESLTTSPAPQSSTTLLPKPSPKTNRRNTKDVLLSTNKTTSPSKRKEIDNKFDLATCPLYSNKQTVSKTSIKIPEPDHLFNHHSHHHRHCSVGPPILKLHHSDESLHDHPMRSVNIPDPMPVSVREYDVQSLHNDSQQSLSLSEPSVPQSVSSQAKQLDLLDPLLSNHGTMGITLKIVAKPDVKHSPSGGETNRAKSPDMAQTLLANETDAMTSNDPNIPLKRNSFDGQPICLESEKQNDNSPSEEHVDAQHKE